MKKRILGIIGAAALAFAGLAVAQTVSIPAPSSMGVNDRIQIIPNGQPSAQSVYATLTQMRAWILGGASGHSGTPVLTSCGTSPTITGTDTGARITTGTGTPTGCVITFAAAFTATPACALVSQTAYATTTPSYTVSTTAVTLTQAATNSAIYNLVCTGS